MSLQTINPTLFQKTISVDSSKRNSGEATSFSITLAIPQQNRFNKISLLMADVPKGYYMFDSSVITESSITYSDTGAGSPVIAFPAGEKNYSASQLAAVLKTMLELGSTATGSGDILVMLSRLNSLVHCFLSIQDLLKIHRIRQP